MQNDYKNTEKLNVRKSLFTYASQPSFATRFVPEFVACKPEMNILDVGCGTGEDLATIAETIPDCVLFGIDNSEGMIEAARIKNPQGTFIVADMETFSLTQKFDRIIIRHALHLTANKTLAIKNIVAHLAPKGKAIFAIHSTQSLPKIGKIVRDFCTEHGLSFLQGQDALAIETSEELFAPYTCQKTTTTDTITLTEPTPYINYIQSRRASFSPPISEELVSKLLKKIEETIKNEIATSGTFTEISINGIITIKT